jgi:hypothetical protein
MKGAGGIFLRGSFSFVLLASFDGPGVGAKICLQKEIPMPDHDNVRDFPREISFTIDGEPFTTAEREMTARALLELAKLDPARYDLGELAGARPEPKRFSDDDIVHIHPKARFVSIRQAADVA